MVCVVPEFLAAGDTFVVVAEYQERRFVKSIKRCMASFDILPFSRLLLLLPLSWFKHTLRKKNMVYSHGNAHCPFFFYLIQ